jgi:hypothetical protein
MNDKELIQKIITDVNSVPGFFKGIEQELERMFEKVVLDNSSAILAKTDEDEFYNFLSQLLDALVPFDKLFKPPVGSLLEMADGPAIKFTLKKFVDKILDKYIGNNWYEKLKDFVTVKQLATIDK